MLVTVAVAAVAVSSADLRNLVLWEHPALSGAIGFFYVKALVIAGIAGWTLRGAAIDAAHVASGALAVGLVSLRGAVWDYYYIDAAAFGFFGARWTDAVHATPNVG